jgi:hypothetical protein
MKECSAVSLICNLHLSCDALLSFHNVYLHYSRCTRCRSLDIVSYISRCRTSCTLRGRKRQDNRSQPIVCHHTRHSRLNTPTARSAWISQISRHASSCDMRILRPIGDTSGDTLFPNPNRPLPPSLASLVNLGIHQGGQLSRPVSHSLPIPRVSKIQEVILQCRVRIPWRESRSRISWPS